MRALVLGPDGPAVRDHAPPERRGEARLRLRLGGVCATDLELCRGYMGFSGVLGHEFVGEVLDAPADGWVGARVVAEINCPCGACETCRAGRPTHCPHRTVLGIQGRDGAFADELSLPLGNLHRVPDDVSDEAAVFVEPLAAACQVAEQLHVRPSDRVGARVLALTGAQVTGVGRNPVTTALLPDHVARRGPEDAGTGYDVVVDCTGSPAGLALATRMVRPRGTVVLKTTTHDLGAASPTAWVIDEVTVVGSRCGPFAPALRLLAAGLVDPTPLITARLPLARGTDALALAGQPGQVKVLIEP